MTRHFLNLTDAGGDAIAAMLNDAIDRKAARQGWPKGKADADAPLAGHTLAMVFEKNSTRTRTSFEMAMKQLGGDSIFMASGQMQLGRGESIADTARVLSRYVDAIMIRTDDHAKVEELAHHASVPVINGLTDLSHPCQIVADLLTITEHGKALPGLELAWLGDGNNVLNSIVEAAGLFQFNVRIAVPQGYESDDRFIEYARAAGSNVTLTRDAAEAVRGADVIVTDTWVSMGQEHAHNKIAAMMPYQVNEQLMAMAKGDAKFLHCLPAHRGEEVTDAVIDGPQSVIWDEAENRLHAQKSILRWCFGQI
ncbi:MAG: ornithine carbamoyltransferase [Sphingomonadales bacterium 35-56-22]|jgi:ornithine carbamoyltransferase|uniref:ornithine carbamoyltransferase n=1 Tax=Sphingorhabdus sp. TaxID=1902408 RepID=UPI000BC424B1|nr:ornithine carbamoyltransferase [Sphingorhabdus sp.]OYY15231.1 MAG: ornithine carbamoyltransferase [Sphingomonadales bacterium 35-56-22]OYY97948.1 MAG: ornithine carbamoyltransferase [Sphingomonadales bacterium 28-56-43]OYZ61183.1 MAG: ornithine carbamoyltransferase [Sphingomonadales bacterium 24-56-14]OZA83173.1 MAG: ornithine carbamoyltransferase [Sphingomonadales bacterium 39-57-19]HQS12457.1 ornithine carbamoyltransferase [Sphingorhabdus sp.]